MALDHALRNAIDGDEEELKFALVRPASRRVPAKTNLNFAEDISLRSDSV